jgi:hypothetical protein
VDDRDPPPSGSSVKFSDRTMWLDVTGHEKIHFDGADPSWLEYTSSELTAIGATVRLRIRRQAHAGQELCTLSELRINAGPKPGLAAVARLIPITKIEAAINAPVGRTAPNLQIADPGGYRKPDDFYASVAERFLWLASVSRCPAKNLAAANGVSVGAVHRWVREAKARGLLVLPNHRKDSR